MSGKGDSGSVANLVGDLCLDDRLAAQLRLRTYPGVSADSARDPHLSPDLRARRPSGAADDPTAIASTQLDFYQVAAREFLNTLDQASTVPGALVEAVRRSVGHHREPAWELRAAANLAHYLAVCSDAIAQHARSASEADLAAGGSWLGGVLRCELVVFTTELVVQAAAGGVDASRVLARIAWNRDCLEWMGKLTRFDPLTPRMHAALQGYPEPRADYGNGAAATKVEDADEQIRWWSLSVVGQVGV